jgi:DNA-binding MarR family transcriptional regulator
MAKPVHRRLSYRLIETGQLLHRAAQAPLRALALSPGDDAILLALARHDRTKAGLADTLGVLPAALAPRLDLLSARGLVAMSAPLQLTAEGRQVVGLLRRHWRRLDAALLGQLKPAERKLLRGAVKRLRPALEPPAAGPAASSPTPRRS